MSSGGGACSERSSADPSASETSTSQVHPFFMPLSSKRAHAVSAADGSKVSSNLEPSPAVPQQLKRQKQKAAEPVVGDKRGRRSKAASGKPTSIHAFFTVNAKRPVAQAETTPAGADAESAADPHLASVDAPDVSSSNNDSASADFTFALSESEIEVAKRKRPLFRPVGVPAPYPAEDTHVPCPEHVPFAYRQAGEARRYLVDAVDTTCIYSTKCDTAYCGLAGSVDGGCAQWRWGFKDSVAVTARRLAYTAQMPYAAIRATPVTMGSQTVNIPPVPAHLEAIVPLVERCRKDNAGASQMEATQLLSLRYRPKKARDVLGNRRAVLRLHSWIESMRIRRSTAASERAVFADPTGISKPTLGGNSHSLKWANRSSGSRGTGKRHVIDTSSDCETDSSDDFMPRRPQRSQGPQRRMRSKDELDDVVAWARSDGSLSSLRENKLVGRRRHRRQGSSGSASESESFTNVVLLEGPSGSGKTAAVYACAEERGFEVYEINPGQRRSGKDVLAVLEDVILSHTITNSATSTAGAACKAPTSVNQLLILIEEVDVLFEQDQRLWPALKQLALKSRRPIVLTCTDSSCLRWEAFSFHFVLKFLRPSESLLVPYCFLLCLCEGALVSPTDVSSLCKESDCDMNRIMCELDIVIRQMRKQPCLESIDSIDRVQHLDMGGALAWLLSPLEPGETAESRYRFWIGLIESVQPREHAGTAWYSLWPDPPPSFEPPAQISGKAAHPKNRIATAHENSFFAQKARAAAAMDSSNPVSIASMFITNSPAPASCALPLFPVTVYRAEVPCLESCADASAWMHDGSAGATSQRPLPGSEVDSLETVVFALDALSLSSAITGKTPMHRECLREPLYSYSSPMTDSCLEVNYAVLDYDVLSRKNSMLLPDSANSAGTQTTADIDRYLRRFAAEALVDDVFSLESSTQSFPRNDVPKESAIAYQLRSALEFVCLKPQRYDLGQFAEAAGYLSHMVRWDWIHQGKEPAPSSIAPEYALVDGIDDVHLHSYRVGMRRTRMNTYRAHIKRMPPEMQLFIVNWSKYCL